MPKNWIAVAITAVALFHVSGAVAQSDAPSVIYLTCGQNGQGGGFPVTIDLIAKTANNKPAQINATSIDWETQHDENPSPGISALIQSQHLDRVSGTLTTTNKIVYSGAPGGQLPGQTYSCVATAPPATKF
jgi:hypothetical protein